MVKNIWEQHYHVTSKAEYVLKGLHCTIKIVITAYVNTADKNDLAHKAFRPSILVRHQYFFSNIPLILGEAKNFQKALVTCLTLCLLVSSADNLCNSLYPDQARQNVGPDLDPICLTI